MNHWLRFAAAVVALGLLGAGVDYAFGDRPAALRAVYGTASVLLIVVGAGISARSPRRRR